METTRRWRRLVAAGTLGLAAMAGLAGCDEQQTRQAEQKLEQAGQEVKQQASEAADKAKDLAHDAEGKLREGTGGSGERSDEERPTGERRQQR